MKLPVTTDYPLKLCAPHLKNNMSLSLNLKARELLPILHDVVRAVERDNADTSAKNKDSLGRIV